MCFDVLFPAKRVQKRWTSAEKDEVRRLFVVYITTKRLPKKKAIESITQSSTILKDRPWNTVREHLRFHHKCCAA